jgi:hypothetical protein
VGATGADCAAMNSTMWTPELRARQSLISLQLSALRIPADMIRDRTDLYYHQMRCGCGATVFPRVTEELPVRCSPCRAEHVQQIIAARTMVAPEMSQIVGASCKLRRPSRSGARVTAPAFPPS